MADPTPSTQGTGLTISDEVKAKYPELVTLILGSESMNDEERQYWINILPIMTPDQIENLRNILTSEREQLAAIDKKYSAEVQNIGQAGLIQKTGDERRSKRKEREEREAKATH